MSLRNTLFAAGFVSLGALGAVTGQAVARSGPAGGPGMGFGHGAFGQSGLASIIQELDLSPEQEAQAQALRDSLRDRFQDRRGAHREIRDQVVAALDAGDRQALHQIVDEQLEARAQDMHASLDEVLDFWEGLSAEQQATAKDIIQEHRQRRQRAREAWTTE